MSQDKPKTPSRTPTLPVGTRVVTDELGPGEIAAVRARKKYAKRYRCNLWRADARWFRRDELTEALQ